MDKAISAKPAHILFFFGVLSSAQALSLTDADKIPSSFINPIYKKENQQNFTSSGNVNSDPTVRKFASIKATYKQKKYQQTLISGQKYLKIYPNDVDVQLFVGLSYYQLKKFPDAINNFKSILDRYPKYKEALYGLIRSKIAYKQYKDALIIVQNGLSDFHGDLVLTQFKAQLKTILNSHHISLSAPKKIKRVHVSPHPKLPTSLDSRKYTGQQAINDLPYYEITAFTLNAAINKPKSIWDWTSIFVYRKSQKGAYGVGVTYANRQNRDAPQILLNAQPKLNERLWLDLGYAYANNPNLFPNNKVFSEGYVKLGKTIVVSGGEQYNQIESKYFNAYTGSVAKYLGNYYFSFRPTHFVPKSGKKSTLYTINARRYSKDNPNKYIGIILASGYSPDLFDLLSIDFIKVKNDIFWIEGQLPINKSVALIYGSGYEVQTFPNEFVRKLAYLNIGLKIR